MLNDVSRTTIHVKSNDSFCKYLAKSLIQIFIQERKTHVVHVTLDVTIYKTTTLLLKL
jgi:hypothetical protein